MNPDVRHVHNFGRKKMIWATCENILGKWKAISELRSVKWRVIRHILLFKTRGKLEPECVSQLFVGSLPGMHL